ncbi:MAG: DUF4065 domain-containing protein [Oscillospiraceae bacterium]|nr:DUF4065 domain-containing protein [Oscillospiraceae bacterium]
MSSAKEAANFFIDLANRDELGDGMTNLRVNKLLYLAQGYCLARTGAPLFDDDFLAWDYGPVVPSIYQRYKKYGRNPIDKVDADYSHESFLPVELGVLIDVTGEYGKYTTGKLVDFTHCTGSPWADAIKTDSKLIDKQSIKSYFNTLRTLDFADAFLPNLDLPLYDIRNSEGVLLLPSDDDDYYAEQADDV